MVYLLYIYILNVLLSVDMDEDSSIRAAEAATSLPSTAEEASVTVLHVQPKVKVSDGDGLQIRTNGMTKPRFHSPFSWRRSTSDRKVWRSSPVDSTQTRWKRSSIRLTRSTLTILSWQGVNERRPVRCYSAALHSRPVKLRDSCNSDS